MPFDRLIRLVDEWAGAHPEQKVFAQTGTSNCAPRNIGYARTLTRDEFTRYLQQADAVVAHAGTGTIIDVLLLNKPLLVLPRLSRQAETRNDHQVGTARHFAEQGQLLAADDDAAFLQQLDQLQNFRPARPIGAAASPQLLERLRKFVATGS